MKKLILISSILLSACGSSQTHLSKADSLRLREDSLASAKLDNKTYKVADNANSGYPMPTNENAQFIAREGIKQQLLDVKDEDFITDNAKYAVYKDSSFVFKGYVKVLTNAGLRAPKAYSIGIKWKGGDWHEATNWKVKFWNIAN